MATFVALLKFTPQGVQNIKDSPRRAAAFKAAAKKSGVKVSDLFWTMGKYDGVIVFEAADAAAASGVMASLAALGNVSTATLPAFDAAEFAAILAKVPKV